MVESVRGGGELDLDLEVPPPPGSLWETLPGFHLLVYKIRIIIPAYFIRFLCM